MSVNIRPYREKDWSLVKAITEKSFKKTYDEVYLKKIVSDPERIVSVAIRKKKVVGFTILRVKPQAYLDTIAVVSHSRRTGIGSMLMSAVETQAKKSGCTVLFLDMHAKGPKKWYEKRGFTVAKEDGFVTFKDGTKSKLLAKGLFVGEVRVIVTKKAAAQGK